ncbi:MAG TPA: phosphate uptake regulator PhoU [Nitrosopumilaceae archaeon]|jgi:phosphate transport system protein
MPRLIDPQLRNLSTLMSEMGELTIQCTSLAIDSYLVGRNTVNEVKQMSDQIRNRYFNLEDIFFDLILKFQPVAEDFRLIRSSTEIAYAFSRLGRYAYDITLVRDNFGDLSHCDNQWLYEVSNEVKSMIKDAILSFAELDINRAEKINQKENFVDKVYKDRLTQLITSQNTKCALAEALVLRYLERIADHAEFMSYSVNYIVTGKHKDSF